MSDFGFTPTEPESKAKVPYFEEARSDYAPYYGVQNWTISKAKNHINAEIIKLGGTVLSYDEGYFGESPKRYGYIIRFVLEGKPGRIKVAGLPMRNPTPARKDKVRVQALLIVRDWLKAGVTGLVFSPGANPLIPHLIGAGNKTLAEWIVEQQELNVPLLADVVEG